MPPLPEVAGRGRRRLIGWMVLTVLAGAGGAAAAVAESDSPPHVTDRSGDAARSQPSAPPEPAGADPSAPETVVPASEPKTLTIAAIGVRAPVGQLGQAADGTVETPPLDQPAMTGWYRDGPTPGEPGSAVILGHVDSRTGPAVFFRLHDLHKGDRIEVARQDGSTVVFVVDTVESVPKTAFPTERVYGDQPRPVLWLITCGGEFDQVHRSYRNNVLVSASLVSHQAP